MKNITPISTWSAAEIKRLRISQLIAINCINMSALALIFYTLTAYSQTFTPFLYLLSISMFIFHIVQYERASSTKRMLPVFHKAAEYEKAKLGEEFEKEQKTKAVSGFGAAGLIFLLALFSHSPGAVSLHTEFLALYILIPFIVGNIAIWKRFSRIDQAGGPEDLEGETARTHKKMLIAGTAGLLLIIIVIMILSAATDPMRRY
ncbi:hypothetical protein [Alkalicoccus daliensis]|uniref:Uncharacterized protein n=1 Tax=Alkalicoccus daliensis TaxID=745820 RepID=A0A1H0CV31_9BACI|nr:hypothetical protein [Alkalicoccus daliensis]SDN61676.1 hypothetical protein SAMN04488053_102240 [Alkalicoccus daliensis]